MPPQAHRHHADGGSVTGVVVPELWTVCGRSTGLWRRVRITPLGTTSAHRPAAGRALRCPRWTRHGPTRPDAGCRAGHPEAATRRPVERLSVRGLETPRLHPGTPSGVAKEVPCAPCLPTGRSWPRTAQGYPEATLLTSVDAGHELAPKQLWTRRDRGPGQPLPGGALQAQDGAPRNARPTALPQANGTGWQASGSRPPGRRLGVELAGGRATGSPYLFPTRHVRPPWPDPRNAEQAMSRSRPTGRTR